jgi:hypothetical protein
VSGDPQRFRVRLVGTALQQAGFPLKPGDFVEPAARSGQRDRGRAAAQFLRDPRGARLTGPVASLAHAEDAHGAVDVLERASAEIVEDEARLLADIIAHGLRDEDAVELGDALQACRAGS